MIRIITIFSLSLFLFACESTKNTDSSLKNHEVIGYPGHNFDLSAFKLQTLTNDGEYIEVYDDELADGHISKYFFTNSDNRSIVMRTPSSGEATSKGTKYLRTELRQTGANSNWSLKDKDSHVLTAVVSVDEVAIPKPQVIIGQIHGSEKNSEMLKIRWTGYRPGECYIEARFQYNDEKGAEYGVKLAEGLSLGDKVEYTITMKQGIVEVTINGKSASQTYTPEFYGDTDHYYFKAGNYLQYKGADPVLWSTVHLYKLSIL